MKKIALLALTGMVLIVSSSIAQTKKLSDYKATDFVPTLETKLDPKKNTIYTPTLLLAWDDIRQSVKTLEVSDDQVALKALDASTSYKDALKEGDYEVKTSISNNEIIAEASFKKNLMFFKAFDTYENELDFEGTLVPAFGLTGNSHDMKLAQISVLYYKNDNNFILELHPRDFNESIVIFKSSKNFSSLAEMNKTAEMLIEKASKTKIKINAYDKVMIPKFAFNIEHDFEDLVGSKCLVNDTPTNIAKAWQKNVFKLDENGAKVESESKIVMEVGSALGGSRKKVKRKLMLLDKPFFIMMKYSYHDPYFSMFVKNTELMQK